MPPPGRAPSEFPEPLGPPHKTEQQPVKNTVSRRRVALTLGLLLPVSAALVPTGASIRFAPEAGLSLTKTFVQSSDASLESVELHMGDETHEVDDVPEITIHSVETIVFDDTYDRVGDGRPAQLTRTYSELGRTREQTTPDGDETSEESSELADHTVVYKWDGDEETFTAAFAEDSQGDENLLAPTWCEADMLGFLPVGEVEEGDTWSVDVDAWRHVLEPGGDLSFLNKEGESNSDEIDQDISDSLDGEIECEFQGFREEDDVRLAVIAVTIDLTGTGDTEEALEIDDNEQVSGGVQHRIVTIETELEGELLWDVAAGHMASFHVVGESSVEMDEGVKLELTSGETFEQSQVLTFASELEMTFTFE